MKILHIAKITNNPFSGVSVVVPQHMIAQSNFADISFFNINKEVIRSLDGKNAIKQISCLDSVIYDIDLVVFHEVYVIDYLWIFLKLLKKQIPYIIVPHGELTIEAQKKKWLKKKVANIVLFNWFINNALALQCLSENELIAINFNNKKFIGTNGIDISDVKKERFNRFNIVFVYIGRLEMNTKGLDIMIAAIAQKADFLREKNCKFKIYGPDGLNRFEAVRKLIEMTGVIDLIELNKEIVGAEKERVLLSSDIFIQTSRTEGMPMGILEALSYGVPCLVTKGTSMGSFIEEFDVGWVAETSVDSVAEAIEKAVLDSNEYVNLSKNGINLVSQHFCWDKIAKSIVSEYKKLLLI